jgi:flagellar export protein FliJ
MKRYHFRLEAVLKMRAMLEETCRNALGLLMVERQNLVESIESLRHDIQSAYFEQESYLSQGVKASHAAFFPQMIEGKNARIKELQAEIKDLDLRIDEKRAELARKRADLKLLENMKDKDFTQWKKSYNKLSDQKVEEMVQAWGENLKLSGERS